MNYARDSSPGKPIPLNQTHMYGAPPLTLACRASSYRMAKLLLDAGALTNVPDQRGNLPIHAACLAGDAKVDFVLVLFCFIESFFFVSKDC